MQKKEGLKIAERKNHKDKKLSYDEVTGISKGVKHEKVEEKSRAFALIVPAPVPSCQLPGTGEK